MNNLINGKGTQVTLKSIAIIYKELQIFQTVSFDTLESDNVFQANNCWHFVGCCNII